MYSCKTGHSLCNSPQRYVDQILPGKRCLKCLTGPKKNLSLTSIFEGLISFHIILLLVKGENDNPVVFVQLATGMHIFLHPNNVL